MFPPPRRPGRPRVDMADVFAPHTRRSDEIKAWKKAGFGMRKKVRARAKEMRSIKPIRTVLKSFIKDVFSWGVFLPKSNPALNPLKYLDEYRKLRKQRKSAKGLRVDRKRVYEASIRHRFDVVNLTAPGNPTVHPQGLKQAWKIIEKNYQDRTRADMGLLQREMVRLEALARTGALTDVDEANFNHMVGQARANQAVREEQLRAQRENLNEQFMMEVYGRHAAHGGAHGHAEKWFETGPESVKEAGRGKFKKWLLNRSPNKKSRTGFGMTEYSGSGGH